MWKAKAGSSTYFRVPRPRALRAAARCASRSAVRRQLPALCQWPAAGGVHGSSCILSTLTSNRTARLVRSSRTSLARLSPPLRDRNLAQMVSSGRRRRTASACALHILGPRSYQRDILVLIRVDRTSGTSGSAIGKALEDDNMKSTPTLPVLLESYFTQRLMAQRQA